MQSPGSAQDSSFALGARRDEGIMRSVSGRTLWAER
jgi:hypothetical protein